MKFTAAFSLILLTVSAIAQNSWVVPFLSADIRRTDQVDLRNLDDNQIFLATPYARSDFINSHVLDHVQGQITSIDLVYSDFQRAQTFDQNGLNARRAKGLFSLRPEVFEDDLIMWSLVGQTGCISHETCATLPHGFLISFRSSQDDPTGDEGDFLSRAVGRMAIYSHLVASDGVAVPYLMDQDAWFEGGMAGFSQYVEFEIELNDMKVVPSRSATYHVDFTIGREGRLVDLKIEGGSSKSVIEAVTDCLHNMPSWSPAIRKGEAISSRKRMIVTVNEVDGAYVVKALLTGPGDPVVAVESMMDEYRVAVQDPVVTAAFERNNWENEAIVMDVTGSMSAYSAQLLMWLKLRTRTKVDLVIFNDGNGQYDGLKRVGETGGIMLAEDCEFDEALSLILEGMRDGTGGDLIENDIEAILRAQSEFIGSQSIILVADNWDEPRDMELVDQINKPVRVVLCGARGGVNSKYLDLARSTGGSVHVIAEDILNLAMVLEGESIEIQGKTYRLEKGRFVRK